MTLRGLAHDPLRNFKYKVEFLGPGPGIRAGFSAVKGLKESTEVVEYREGTDPARMRKLFGQTSYEPVTLERGLTQDRGLSDWRRAVKDALSGRQLSGEGVGDFPRRHTIVTLGEYHGRTEGQWVWELYASWPSEYTIGDLSGDGNDVVVESVVLQHEGLVTRAPQGAPAGAEPGAYT